MRAAVLAAFLLAAPVVARADFPPDGITYLTLFGCNATICENVQWNKRTDTFANGSTLDIYHVMETCSALAGNSQLCPNGDQDHLVTVTGNGVTWSGYIGGDNIPGGGPAPIGPTADALGGIFYYNTGNPQTGPNTTGAIVMTTTPEPAEIVLMGTGLLVLGVARRRVV